MTPRRFLVSSSSKDSNTRGTSALALIKVALGLDVDARIRCTTYVTQRWSFQQATVMLFVDFASAFDSVGRDCLWRVMASDGMAPKLLRLIKAYYSSTKMKVRASGSDSMPFEIRSGVRQRCAISPTLFNYIIDWILFRDLQDYPGVQVGANVHVSNLAYADAIVILSRSYSETQGLLESVNRQATAVRCTSTPRRPRRCQHLSLASSAVLLDGDPLEDFGKLKYLGSMFVAIGQGNEEISSKINLARSAFSRLQSSLVAA